MKRTNVHIEIVSTTISGLSSMSKRSRDAAQAALSLYYTNVDITIINDLSDLEDLVERKPDLVFLGMQFLLENPSLGIKASPKIWISEYLDEVGIAYTGSCQPAHELERSKPLAKRCVQTAGVKTSPFMVIEKNTLFAKSDIKLPFPLFVKPSSSGGGVGIDDKSLVHNFEELRAKVMSISTNHRSDSLIEAYLPGREFSVAILADEFSDEPAVMPIELKAMANENGEHLLSQAVKSANTEEVYGVTEGSVRDNVVSLALRAFYALGARDYARIDIRLDRDGAPNFIEANLIPSLIDGYGSFPKSCYINADMGYEAMLVHIVRLALQRWVRVDMSNISEEIVSNRV